MMRASPALVLASLLPAACVHLPRHEACRLHIPRASDAVRVDGVLDEACYGRLVPVTDFKVASRPGALPPATRAWLQWDARGLWFALAADDATPLAHPPTADEHAVDAQDRLELFLWPEGSQTYYCIEIAPDGAVHDYAARVYRQFDDAWSANGAEYAAKRTADGYAVEGFIPADALRQMGVRGWSPGARFLLGLYRAEFRPDAPDDPVWITWIEPNLPEPDFHIRATFAPVVLAP